MLNYKISYLCRCTILLSNSKTQNNMKPSSKNWLLLLVCGVALVLSAVLVLAFNEQVIHMLVYVAGFALFILGVVLCVMAFSPSRRDERAQLLVFAFGNIALGATIMITSDILLLLVGVAIVLNGTGLILEGLHLKRLGSERWAATLLSGVGVVVAGVIVALFYKAITAALGVSIGLVLLTAGLALVILALMTRKGGKNEIVA